MNVKKYLLIGIPILFLVGSLSHFAYDFFNQAKIIGYFTPINESVWEHSKMSVFPLVIYYVIYLYIDSDINYNRWFTALLFAIIVSVLLIFMIYYFYTEAFGVEIMIIDILILLIALAFSMILSYHIYKYFLGYNYILMIILIVVICIMYFYFTYNPPNFPIFIIN